MRTTINKHVLDTDKISMIYPLKYKMNDSEKIVWSFDLIYDNQIRTISDTCDMYRMHHINGKTLDKMKNEILNGMVKVSDILEYHEFKKGYDSLFEIFINKK